MNTVAVLPLFPLDRDEHSRASRRSYRFSSPYSRRVRLCSRIILDFRHENRHYLFFFTSIAIATRAAETFIKLYYTAYDSTTRVADLPNFYRPSSSITWNGNALQGQEGVKQLVEKMPPTHHEMMSFDCHPIPGTTDYSTFSVNLTLNKPLLFQDLHHLLFLSTCPGAFFMAVSPLCASQDPVQSTTFRGCSRKSSCWCQTRWRPEMERSTTLAWTHSALLVECRLSLVCILGTVDILLLVSCSYADHPLCISRILLFVQHVSYYARRSRHYNVSAI